MLAGVDAVPLQGICSSDCATDVRSTFDLSESGIDEGCTWRLHSADGLSHQCRQTWRDGRTSQPCSHPCLARRSKRHVHSAVPRRCPSTPGSCALLMRARQSSLSAWRAPTRGRRTLEEQARTGDFPVIACGRSSEVGLLFIDVDKLWHGCLHYSAVVACNSDERTYGPLPWHGTYAVCVAIRLDILPSSLRG